jgi:hypothetical protein
MPLDYTAGEHTDIYFPLATDAANEGALPGPEFPKGGSNHGYYGIARLAPGATAPPQPQLRDLVAELREVRVHGERRLSRYVIPMDEQ